MRPKTIILTIVVAVGMAGLLGPGERSSSGAQDPIRKEPSCTIFCGDGTFNTINLGAFPCWGGPLPAEGARDYFKSLAEEDQAAICRNFAAANKSKESCPTFKALAQLCRGKEKPPDPGDKKPKCEPPRDRNRNPPWFNKDLPCQNRQEGTYSWAPYRRDPTVNSVSISMCGQVIRYITRGPALELTALGLRSFDVCCDTWQNAVSTGSPCDALRDIDCDGMLNETDRNSLWAPLKKGRSDDFVSNPPLTSTLPFWRQVYEAIPEQSDCKDCKWELVGVQYTCKEEVERTGRRSESINAEYKYEATWKCPANGSTTVTNDYATMKGSEQRRGSPCCRCPSPPSGSWP